MAAVGVSRMDLGVSELRAAAKRAVDTRQACRILAIAMVMDGYPRAAAAQACGMDRQTLRDWVHRYNQEGLAGLVDRPRSGRPGRLSPAQEAEIVSWVEAGADLAVDGVVRFRLVDLCKRIGERFGVCLNEDSVGRILRRRDYRRLSTRPQHPEADLAAQEAFKKTSRTWSAKLWTGAPPVAR
jgi:transposase